MTTVGAGLFFLGVALVLVLGLLVGLVLIQIALSKASSRWPGLVLPGVFLILATVAMINVASYSVVSLKRIERDGVGQAVSQERTTALRPSGGLASWVVQMGSVFLLCNIPTAVCLGIYGVCKSKQKSTNRRQDETQSEPKEA